MPATGRPSFFLSLAKAGFNYDKMADQQARKNAERPIGELVSSLRANAAKSAPMPGFPERITVGHVAIHTQDIRRPNDLPGAEEHRWRFRRPGAVQSRTQDSPQLVSAMAEPRTQSGRMDGRRNTGMCFSAPCYPGEVQLGTINDAAEIPVGQLPGRVDELDPSKPTVVFCAGGYRSSVAASVLRQARFEDVSDILGGYGAWVQLTPSA